MIIKELKPRKALNKAFLKVKPIRTDIELFKTNLITLLDGANDAESEEFHKNLVSDFLKDTYYKQNHFINTKGRNDLVIHNGSNANSSVGVIIEAKKPTNKAEMITTTKLNVKAFHELALYYLRERITHKNIEIKHLVATNINEWFIFDAATFDRLFAQNKHLVKQFNDFESKRLADTKTDFFYKQIAAPFIAELETEIEFAYFNLQDYQKPLRSDNKADDNKLIALFKLLSPEHLLKLPFANDSNSLDKRFYSELLHIIGLTETKEGGKKLIRRNKEDERNTGSILEGAIIQLDSLDKISRLERAEQFGNSRQEKLFNVALELTITWINRILFLKLLEAQLIAYHRFDRLSAGKGDSSYAFLNLDKIKSYNDLNSLFFQVLARKHDERTEDVKTSFEKVPFLNSSLFEPTDIEHSTLFISDLRDDLTIPIISTTVLKDEHGKKRTGRLSTLEYLFDFLNAYDFSSEGSEDIQEDNKTLINASVLGLIFEKINGYKEGSFFTPGFITMYMCRETIRKAVVQKFNETKGWQCKNFNELKEDIAEAIKQGNRKEVRKEANSIVNDLKICDPAVGSGHFLVSALNEMIAVKSELKILVDKEFEPIATHKVEVVNDELALSNLDDELFEYNPKNKESQRIQETLFYEKQTIIENCLFGVDINPNSVKICRLRLWIELLKNAYYKSTGFKTSQPTLETLPNIDINIKCGNSLVSRFSLDVDLKKIARHAKWNIFSYQNAVEAYKRNDDKETKRELETLIRDIKSNYEQTIQKGNPKLQKYIRLRQEYDYKFPENGLFAHEPAADYGGDAREIENEKQRLSAEIEKIKGELDIEKRFYETHNAFEWRFEFPEVLNEDGDFTGFDLIIGNPPYIRIQDLKRPENNIVDYLKTKYLSTGRGNFDIYIPFIELGYNLIKSKGQLSYIMPHKFINAKYGAAIREFLRTNAFLHTMIHFGSSQVFEDATTYTGVFFMIKKMNDGISFLSWSEPSKILNIDSSYFIETPYSLLSNESWDFISGQEFRIMNKLKSSGITLESVTERIFQGLKTSADRIYIVKKLEETETSYVVFSDAINQKIEIEKTFVFPLIKGGNSRPFKILNTELLIIFPYENGKLVSFERLQELVPKTSNYLIQNKEALKRRESYKFSGNAWHQFGRNQAIDLIRKAKIFTPDIAPSPRFCFDKHGEYLFTGGVSGGYGLIPNEDMSFYFLLGLLNSKITKWFIKVTSTQMRGGWFSFESRYIKNLPMPIIMTSKKLEKLVLRAIKEDKSETTIIKEIDHLVYQLYGLTDDEIKIIESA
jgi:adenine-specific DNA-methyltransferase